jgi:type VI secretion system secreted protein VgrG
MPLFSKANEPRFLFEAGGTELMVIDFSLQEFISEPFSAGITLASEQDIAFDAMVGENALLTLESMESGESTRYLQGIVNRFTQSGVNGRYYLYKAQVVPLVELLRLEKDCRIFQNLSVPDIIKQVLEESQILSDRFKFRLTGTYEPREYCVQYRESDLDFVQRLCSEEGIFYFFEHTRTDHLMVFGDSTVNYQPIGGNAAISFNPGFGMVAEQEAVIDFQLARQIHTGKYTLRDFNYEKPALGMEVDISDEQDDRREIYDYPGEYALPEQGRRLARVRLEQAVIYREQGRGASVAPRMVPGFTFTLKQHELTGLNGEYLLTQVVHTGSQTQVLSEKATDQGTHYENSFIAIPSAATFRPENKLPKPFIEGVQTAIVTGPSGEEIYTDKLGRVKVQFHWDRQGQKDEKSSCWVRVSQLWAGPGWGAMFIPRIGQEVIVDFIEGDPDRPIITGRVYNGGQNPPYPLPEEKTKSTIKSNTSKEGGGFNELRFEDKKGSEEIYIHGQKDWTIAIENDKNQTVGHDETLKVTNDRSKTVDKNQDETIGENKSVSVGKSHTESIGENMSVSIGKKFDESTSDAKSVSVGKSLSESVGEDATHTVGKNRSITVSENNTLDIGKDHTENIGKKMTLTVGEDAKFSIGKNLSIIVNEKTVINSSKELTLNCGGASIILKQDGKIQIKGKDIKIDASGNVSVKGSKITQN